MKPSSIALACSLFAQSVAVLAAPAAAPLRYDIYVRGAFNGWGTDNVMAYKGQGVYETDILVSPGNHAFKIGSKDWTAEWVANPSSSVTVALGTVYPLDTHPGPEDYLFAKQTETYRFRVDASNPAKPLLSVTRVATPPVAAGGDPHAGAAAQASLTFATWDGKQESARFSTKNPQAPLRTYVQSTTMQLRDPGPQFVSYTEEAGLPVLRSGNLAFDALFALAGHEMKQDSVKEIRDGNYNGNAPIPCDCFETGEKWHYVWTRDLSYAADLGLAMLDPQRVRNSLMFKLSGFRPGIVKAPQVAGTADGFQIAQDTGSGGSWPVSTDRITWAFAAEDVLQALPPEQRPAFAATALKALSNTIENDRLADFDKATGLYTGEESFLDWRDQSYAKWIPDDLSSLASSKSLSTNVGHYKALSLAAQLAREQNDNERAERYAGWARDLKQTINARLWLDDAGMYSGLTAPHFDGAPMHKFDWLGQSLAIITGVANGERAKRILSSYPHGPMGAPVIWPQQPDLPVYHNRAMWPFVTAYGLRAAALAGNVSVADAAYDTLVRGAALNLSNMENLEWLSGQPLLLDQAHPNLIGPVISSRRQLWSVGAYLGMVIRDLFGVSTTAEGISLHPFVTAKLRNGVLADSERVELRGLRLQGRQLDVALRLPARTRSGDKTGDKARDKGYYAVERITVDGKPAGDTLHWDQLKSGSRIEIVLGALQAGDEAIHRVSADPYSQAPAVFGPREPRITGLARAGAGNVVTIAASDQNGLPPSRIVYNVYRDGRLVAAKVAAGAWTDRSGTATNCYAAEAQYPDSGNRSHHSIPRCVDEGLNVSVMDKRVQASMPVAGPNARFAEPHLANWGKPQDQFTVSDLRVPQAGDYAVQVRYHNGANQVNLGISGGVKWLAVTDESGAIVAEGVVQLPHARIDNANTPTVYSTPLAARLAPNVRYRLQLSDFYNMSYLQSNSTFSAAGGVDGPSNRFDIYGVRLLRVR